MYFLLVPMPSVLHALFYLMLRVFEAILYLSTLASLLEIPITSCGESCLHNKNEYILTRNLCATF